jgi:uncharacterized membrane protein
LEGSLVGVEKIAAELAHAYPARGEQRNEQPDAPVVM